MPPGATRTRRPGRRGPARNMSAMAASEALRAREGHPKRGSNALKLGLRIVVSAALLAFLVTKIPSGSVEPKDTHAGTLDLPRGRARAHVRRVRALGLALAAGARGVRRPHPAEDAARLLPRRPVRGQRAAVDDRRRRPPRQPGLEDHRRRHRVRVGRDRAPHRFRRAPAPHAARHRDQAVAPRRPARVDRDPDLARHGRGAARDRRGRRQPAPGRALRQARELDALRRRGAHRGRPDAPRAGPRHERAHRRHRLPGVGGRRGVVRGARARRVRSRRVGARLRPRGGDGAGAPDLALGARHPRRSARAAAAPARRAHRQGDRRRACSGTA